MQVPVIAKLRNAIGGKYTNYVITIPTSFVKNGLVREGQIYKVTLEPIQTELEGQQDANALSGAPSRDSKDLSFLGQLSRLSGHHAPTSLDCPDHRVPAFACGQCAVASDKHEVIRVTN